jgi:amidohydrolase
MNDQHIGLVNAAGLKAKIHALSAALHAETVRTRRHLHENPELSFQEYQTAEFVKNELIALGLEPVSMAETGLVALIKGGIPSDRVIALRADMDALPIQEVPGRSYGSKNPGVMHACGHDVHTSSLLAVAKILVALKEEIAGTIKLIFQPGEEKLPGGASLMIKAGALQNPAPQAIIGQHVMPSIPVGKVGFRPGKYMASTDELYFTVRGKGGHGAQPQSNIDPVLITAHLIVALQQLVSRMADPRMPSVLSIGRVEANGATNVIPDEVKLAGTFRTFDEKWRKKAQEQIRKLAEGLCESMGGSCEVDIQHGYPYLANNEALTHEARQYAVEFMGEDKVIDLDLWMAGEDFAYYSQVTDACFYRIGTGNEAKGITSAVHTSTFDIDEDALSFGPGLMAYIALRQLGNV